MDNKVNDHTINRIKSKWSFSDQIYSLEPIELEILKRYMKIIPIYGLLKSFKSSTNAPIIFVEKFNSSYCL